MNFLLVYFILRLCLLADLTHGQQCQTTNGGVCECVISSPGYTPTITPCPSDYPSMSKILKSSRGRFLAYCCVPGTVGEFNQKVFAEACLPSNCVSNTVASSTSNLCETPNGTLTALEGQLFDYVETKRDMCLQSDGSMGTIAACCKPNSLDVVLSSILVTEDREFSHFVRLGKSGDYCGATVYNDQWILTASHCVTEYGRRNNVDEYEKGDPELNNKAHCASDDVTYLVNDILPGDEVKINPVLSIGNSPWEYEVDQIVVHPGSYRLGPDNGQVYNDLALVKLKNKIVFGPNVKALRIAPKGFKPLDHGDKAVLIGYGNTDTFRQPSHLQKITVPIRPTEDYATDDGIFSSLAEYKDQLLLVGGMTGDSTSGMTGSGDSGGPAVCRGADGTAILCGLTTGGASNKTACEIHWDEAHCLPNIYMNIGYFHDWIQCVAGPQQEQQLLHQPLFGSPAPAESSAHQVHITSDSGRSCGVTLITKNVVLTAAHCVADDDGNTRPGLTVTSGDGQRSFTPEAVQVHEGFAKVAGSARTKRLYNVGMTRNPNRVSKTDKLYTKNLALLKLDGDAVDAASSIPRRSTNQNPSQGTELSYPLDNPVLSQRQFKFLSRDECQRRVDKLASRGKNVTIDDDLLCGVETYSGGSLCDRELGGGIFCGADNKELCGVQVFRMCEFSLPNLFVNVAKEQTWILQNLAQILSG